MDIHLNLKGLYAVHLVICISMQAVNGDVTTEDSLNITHQTSARPIAQPVVDLEICLEEIFSDPVRPPQASTTKATVTATASTSTTPFPFVPPRCIYTDGQGNPEVFPPKKIRRRRSVEYTEEEISDFHRCLCRISSKDNSHRCHFHLMELGYDRTVLNTYLGSHVISETGQFEYGMKEFSCILNRHFVITCRIQHYYVPYENTRFQKTLTCLEKALESHVCEILQTTTPRPPVTTETFAATITGGLSYVSLIILIMGCVLCLLFGVLGTVCAVVCCSRKRRRKSTAAGQQVIYHTTVTQDCVHADLLQDAPDQPPELPQTLPPQSKHSPSKRGRQKGVNIDSTLASVFYEAGANDDDTPPPYPDASREEYEPLQRDRQVSEPRLRRRDPNQKSGQNDLLLRVNSDESEYESIS